MEFGSDFNLINYPKGNGLPFRIPYNLYASGRQALYHLVREYKFDTIWIPTYYCGESIEFLYSKGYSVKRYSCIPTDNPKEVISNLPLEINDLLVRFNFFGLYGFQDNKTIPCPVIEDYSHSLTCEWAMNSDADWCFASLRKTMPVADGGILWSPKEHHLPQQPLLTTEASDTMAKRYQAMSLKTEYLNNTIKDKSEYLSKFRETEALIGTLMISDVSKQTSEILSKIDLDEWLIRKRHNLKYLLHNVHFKRSKPLLPDNNSCENLFSLIVLFESEQNREEARRYLISHEVYPSVLWPDVDSIDKRAVDFSRKMLSIHCDGRYTISEMKILCNILNNAL